MVGSHEHHGKLEEAIENMATLFRARGIYYIARLIVLFIFVSLLFFPHLLNTALHDPTLLALLVGGPFVLAITLLADLLVAEQRTISSLIFKYLFLTLSVVLLFGLFFYVNATVLQPPGLHRTTIKTDAGVTLPATPLEQDVFYLSATTYFTIGYGDVVPIGTYARMAAVFEAFTGGIINLVVLAMAFQRLASRGPGRAKDNKPK
ncbi:MAG: hypothetical protein KGH63_03380 [Candidatus Micrarchaeota archaeon]|nr:hypothetical protein [Candidatus Micrarchaeota archaeon]